MFYDSLNAHFMQERGSNPRCALSAEPQKENWLQSKYKTTTAYNVLPAHIGESICDVISISEFRGSTSVEIREPNNFVLVVFL